MIVYDRLWETMKKKDISQYRLVRYFKVSSGQLGRLKKNTPVSTHTIDMLCKILECRVEDIMEYRSDICEITETEKEEQKEQDERAPE